jgi:DNA-directed RNA polymerase subunit N (RpoN/RPB10)
LAKGYEMKCGAIGNILVNPWATWEHIGNALEIWCKYIENLMGIWWEQLGEHIDNLGTYRECIRKLMWTCWKLDGYMVGTAWGTHWQLGNISGMHWEFYLNTLTTLEHIGNALGIWNEHIENLMGTWWEQIGNIKIHWIQSTFSSSPKEKKNCASWVRAKSPHWFNRTSINYGHPFLL